MYIVLDCLIVWKSGLGSIVKMTTPRVRRVADGRESWPIPGQQVRRVALVESEDSAAGLAPARGLAVGVGAWRVPRPRDWRADVNGPETETEDELEGLRHSIQRVRPMAVMCGCRRPWPNSGYHRPFAVAVGHGNPVEVLDAAKNGRVPIVCSLGTGHTLPR
jgi:hypothetical protein